MPPHEDGDASDSVFVAKEPCPGCCSRDNLGRYSDGHAYCFSSSCSYYEKRDGEVAERLSSDAASRPRRETFNPIHYEILGLPKRGLSEKTCRHWDYGVGEFNGAPCHFSHYRDPTTRELVAQKVRTAGKDFPVLKADGAKLPLYGQHLWRGDRRSLIVTEGELDAMSVSQVQDHKYPVVSLSGGAGNAVNDIKRHYEWLCEFDKIVLMFDDDQPGREAAEACAELLPCGKVFIASIEGYKDANEALVDGKPSAITSAFWNAKPYQPDGIFTLDDIEEEVLAPVVLGRPWFLPTLTELTFGRRDGEVIYFGAGTGVGKTDFFTTQICHDVLDLGIPTACIYLEQPPAETGKRIAGKAAGKQFHIPDGSWTQDELKDTFNELKSTGKLFLGGNFSSASWESIKARMRFMAVGLGVKHFYLDHLTALADPSKERESLEIITKELALMAQELSVVIHVISHLATPEGKPHEEGGRVMMRHFKGSRAIGFWAHFAFGLERNPQHEDAAIASQTTLRCLKDRYTGRATGKTITLAYDTTTGLISECLFPAIEGGREGSFAGQSLEV
jgi:twinkle protein